MIKSKKIGFLIIILISIFVLTVSIPTLSRIVNRNIDINNTWDGSIANSYYQGNGSENNPYVITNAKELAYFSQELLTNNYDNTYFVLNNDIIINDGNFVYENNEIKYVLNNTTYYVNKYTNRYYSDIDKTTMIGTINSFNSLNNFKGHFDGKSYRIYGLYNTSSTAENLGLFVNLEGTVQNLYIENALIYGGNKVGGLASNSNDATISHVLFNGYIIGNQIDKHSITNPIFNSLTLNNESKTTNIALTNTLLINDGVISSKLKGNYMVTDPNAIIKINGTVVNAGSFSIDLGSKVLDSVSISVETLLSNVTFSLSDLQYDITYQTGICGGIIGESNNTILNQVVNKGYIYGGSISAGLIGIDNGTDIIDGYNSGIIKSNYLASGLIGVNVQSNSNVHLTNTYNKGELIGTKKASLIGIINASNVTFTNSFNPLSEYAIDTINNSTVNASNSYCIDNTVLNGTMNTDFNETTYDNLINKTYAINTLKYPEFISLSNLNSYVNNKWIYENNSLPILYFDDISNSLGIIHANIYSYDNLSEEIKSVSLSNDLTFSIDPHDALVLIKEKYYYLTNQVISDSNVKKITGWITYSDAVQIKTDGVYIIYAKVVDYNNNISYMNSDRFVVNNEEPLISINNGNYAWHGYHDSLDYVYLNKSNNITITVTDNLLQQFDVKYYLTNQLLSIDDLKKLDNNSWINYQSSFLTNDNLYVIYVKVTDEYGLTYYANSDYVVLGGYTNTYLSLGQTKQYSNPNITSKSSVTMNYIFDSVLNYGNGYIHNVVSSMLLPMGTVITLIDNVDGKVYSYEITSNEDIYGFSDNNKANYPFTLFNEIGNVNTHQYVEKSYYVNNANHEDFTIKLDFANTSMTANYNNVYCYIELQNGNKIISTLEDSIKKFNIYSNVNNQSVNATVSLVTDYSGNNITYNSNSLTNINLLSIFEYKTYNGMAIIDTTYDDKSFNLYLRIEDINNNVISRDYFKNMIFKIGNDEYSPNADGGIYIALNDEQINTNNTLSVMTKLTNSTLQNGIYYLKISNYSSYGFAYTSFGNTISIPIVVDNSAAILNHSFDVLIENDSRIIDKTSENSNLTFNIEINGLSNPNVRVSLYKKDQLTAYNQDYSIIDLNQYMTNQLEKVSDNIYYALKNNIQEQNSFSLQLKVNDLENTGYKFVFELYNDEDKIDKIEKYFIIR